VCGLTWTLQRRAPGKRVLLVMGANWCSDSRALAVWLATERFKDLVQRKYELVYAHIGIPGAGDRLNLGIANGLGVPALAGSPTYLLLRATEFW
jgi:hypothetical protein